MAQPALTWLLVVALVWMSSFLFVSSKINQFGCCLPRRISNDSRLETNQPQKGPSLALFLQADREGLFRESLGCLKSFLEQSRYRADVFVGVHCVCEPKLGEILQEVVALVPKTRGSLVVVQNFENSAGIFLEQMKYSPQSNSIYNYALKIAAMGDMILRQRIQESLCGTSFQVEAVIHQFIEKPDADLIAPLGLLYGPDSDPTNIMPHLLQKYPNHGLGYYDLLDTETRRRQGQLAQKGGVYGFVYYHYWFNGEVSLPEHKALYGVLEKMLDDGEPNLPFMLSWVNEPWTKTRASNKEEILLSQNYGNMREWEEHFNYLYKFFSHPNYIRIMDEPVFIIYKTFHIGSILPAMLKCWNNLAKERGLKGIKIVSTIGDFPRVMELPPAIEETTPIHGSFHFWPKLQSWKALETFAASQRDVTQFPPRNQYWGVCSGSDQRVRGVSSTLPPLLVSPKDFGKEMRSSFWAMSQKAGRDIDLNYFFINAWNEWNEQATLEPDTMYRFGYLNELRGSLRRVPALWREPVREPERVWADPSRESLGDDDADESSKRDKGSKEKRRKRERAKLENANKILI